MAEQRADHAMSLVVASNQPLIAIPLEENGREVTRYYVGEATGETSLPESVQDALSLAGAWNDLDWGATVEALDRIRHASKPTPPIDSIDV